MLLVSFVLLFFVIYLVRHEMRDEALVFAREKSLILLDRNLATHSYFSNVLKPAVFEATKTTQNSDYFDPVWMSSTYVVREVDKIFRNLSSEDYYYKECAINARHPENEADPFERDFLNRLNASEVEDEIHGVREIDGKPYFYVLKRGETMASSCMICYDQPDMAPAGLVGIYGPDRSFHRNVNDVVSAISIRIPLQDAFSSAQRFTNYLYALFAAIIFVLFAAQFYLTRKLLLNPIKKLQSEAAGIVTDQSRLGHAIELPPGRELKDLTSAFNSLSLYLRKEIDTREGIIQERMGDLMSLNERLKIEIEKRRSVENEQHHLIHELQAALSKVKLLSGFLPICASCKKIRNDKGYWQQIESYIRDHSNAEFTHSLCEDCVKIYFPEQS